MFFILAKILGFFSMPSNVLMSLGVIGVVLTATRRARAGRRLPEWRGAEESPVFQPEVRRSDRSRPAGIRRNEALRAIERGRRPHRQRCASCPPVDARTRLRRAQGHRLSRECKRRDLAHEHTHVRGAVASCVCLSSCLHNEGLHNRHEGVEIFERQHVGDVIDLDLACALQ